MNEHALNHIPDSKYCFAISENEIVLRLRTAKNEPIKQIHVIYSCKYDFSIKREYNIMEKKYTDRLYDYYVVTLKLLDVRLAYIFKIFTNSDEYFYSEDGLTETYDFDYGYYNFFQYAYINDIDLHKPVEWMAEAVFYQIFVDRFNIGDKDKDCGYIDLKWGDKPTPKNFAGGDLKGIINKLDYLNDYGFNAIYLTPIFKSISNHKYDISDYKNLDPQFGKNKDLHELVAKAHEKNVKIVLDAVFNHCSDQTAQFQDVLKNGDKSPYFHWFKIDGKEINENRSNFECFASCNYMPKFNTSNIEVQNYLINIAVYWIKEYDIDGWRLDVSDEVSHVFWRRFRQAVKQTKMDCVIIGENWHDANSYLLGDQYDSIMNYSFTKACLDFYAFCSFDSSQFIMRLNELLMRNTDTVNAMMLNLLDSHDTHRFLTQVKGNKKKLLSALCVTMFFIGTPCIYYGTEICMEGGYDPDCRRTYEWDSSKWDYDFIDKLKSLIKLKKTDQLQRGQISMKSEDGLFILERKYEGKFLKLYINNTVVEKKPKYKGKVILQSKEGCGIETDGFKILEG